MIESLLDEITQLFAEKIKCYLICIKYIKTNIKLQLIIQGTTAIEIITIIDITVEKIGNNSFSWDLKEKKVPWTTTYSILFNIVTFILNISHILDNVTFQMKYCYLY